MSKGWFPLRKTFLRTGTARKVSFMLEPLVPTESSQDKGNFPVRSRPEENYPEWKPVLIHTFPYSTMAVANFFDLFSSPPCSAAARTSEVFWEGKSDSFRLK